MIKSKQVSCPIQILVCQVCYVWLYIRLNLRTYLLFEHHTKLTWYNPATYGPQHGVISAHVTGMLQPCLRPLSMVGWDWLWASNGRVAHGRKWSILATIMCNCDYARPCYICLWILWKICNQMRPDTTEHDPHAWWAHLCLICGDLSQKSPTYNWVLLGFIWKKSFQESVYQVIISCCHVWEASPSLIGWSNKSGAILTNYRCTNSMTTCDMQCKSEL